MNYKIKYPTELSEVKLKDLLTFSKLDKGNEQLIMYKAFEFFTSTSKEALQLIPYTVAEKVIKGITNTLNSTPEERLIIELDGVKYGRIPNLENISFGELIEMDTFGTMLAEGEAVHENAFKFLSCLWRPIVDEVEVRNGQNIYSIEPFTNEYLDSDHWLRFQEHCPSDIYATSIRFFLTLRIELLKAMQVYFKGVKVAGRENSSQKLMDGMEVLKHTQQEHLEHLMQPLMILMELPYISYSMMQKHDS
jgi:hypothetical protein